jgi:hypothetical protein
MNKLHRTLGTICDHCPLCAKARREPETVLGRIMAWHGRFCPAWKAQEHLAAERLIDFREKT